MKKSLFSILLMLLPLVASSAYAAQNINGINYNFYDDTGTAEVTSGVNYTGNVVIPDLVTNSNGVYIVTRIGNHAFNSCDGLKSVTIPATVTSIGDYAFWRCSGLTSVDIPNSVTSIDNSAFKSCSSLTSVTIPNSVTSIGIEAFYSCPSLTSVDIPNSVASIGNNAFKHCTALETVTIHNPETNLGYWVFSNTKWLNSQPDGLVYLDKILYCYKGTMPDNTSIDIKEGTLSIAGAAFESCASLTSVTIPNSVKIIGCYAFEYCSGLTSVDIPNSVTSIDYRAFQYCSGLTSVTLGNSVTSIGNHAFQKCSDLTSVTIPSSVTSIEPYTFYYCTNLSSVTIPSSVRSIGYCAFQGCEGLKELDIPGSVTSIANYAFADCAGLEKVIISGGIKLIGPEAFARFKSSSIDVYCYAEQVPNADKTAFLNSGNILLHVPAQSKAAYEQVEPWKNCWAILDNDMDIEKCAKPTINFTNGKLSFSSATEGAVFVYDIKSSNSKKVGAGEEVTVAPTCIVSVVATKPGYSNSEPAVAELDLTGAGSSGDLNADGKVDDSDVKKLVDMILK